MQIVIDIPDDIYEQAINGTEYDTLSLGIKLRQSVQEGVVIPKGHGRIIDESKITQTTYETIEEEFESMLQGTIKHQYVVFKGSDAPTIIEADKEDKECI